MLNLKEFNWGPASFIIVYHVFLLLCLPYYLYTSFPSWGIWLTAFILLYATGLSITAGYHRLFSHRAYKAQGFVESLLLFFGAMSAQGSALRWSFDHRIHHAFVDTDQDPYSIKKGFWYAHCLWILEKPQPIDPKVVPDLIKNKKIAFQHEYYGSFMFLSNALVCALVGWLLNDYWGAFFIATFFRIFVLHHCTWFINSLAHTWGDKPFCQEQTAVNNYILALLTFGEGYHNYHHVFANDYRNGIRWYHFDPTKWLIWTLNKLRLAHNLKSMDQISINKRMVMERKNLLLESIRELWNEKKEELALQIHEHSDRILEQISHFHQLKEKYDHLKKASPERDLLVEMRKEIKEIKRKLKTDWREWSRLSKNILGLKRIDPLPS